MENVADQQIQDLQAEVARLKQELEETRRTTTRYLQNVAHQLTAPLNAIKWNIEAIKDEKIPIPRKKNLLSSIYSQGTILVHLIKNFSLMSNLEADHELGQFRDQPERVSPLRLAINQAADFDPQAAETSKENRRTHSDVRQGLWRQVAAPCQESRRPSIVKPIGERD